MLQIVYTFRCTVGVFHRIHRCQQCLTDTTGTTKHRLSPYNAYYHNNKPKTLWLPISVRTKHAF